MNNLISRKEALSNKVFASFIAGWQKRFDPSDDLVMTEEGSYWDYELDKERFFAESEIDAINEKELKEYLNLKDEIEPLELVPFGELKYNLAYKDIAVYAMELGKTLEQLSQDLQSDIIFMLDYSVPWLSQDNDYNPVVDAVKYLKEFGVAEDYVGAFKLNGDELAKLTTNLFWLFRCNASLPYCWFTTDQHPFVGNICQYGNIHLHTYSQEIKEVIESFARTIGLVEIDRCEDAFDDRGTIEGRQIII